jgi:hypothetical protein
MDEVGLDAGGAGTAMIGSVQTSLMKQSAAFSGAAALPARVKAAGGRRPGRASRPLAPLLWTTTSSEVGRWQAASAQAARRRC